MLVSLAFFLYCGDWIKHRVEDRVRWSAETVNKVVNTAWALLTFGLVTLNSL